MRLCLIGNSHLAALLNSWEDTAPSYPDVQATFFGTRAQFFFALSAAGDGRLTMAPRTMLVSTGGQGEVRVSDIPLGDFDLAVVIGCGFSPSAVLRTYQDYHFHGLRARRPTGVTREQFKYGVRDKIDQSPAWHVISLIRSQSRLPVLLAPSPLPSEEGVGKGGKAILDTYAEALANEDARELLRVYADICRDLAEQGVRVVNQPEATKAAPLSTMQIYSIGSSRLRSKDRLHADDDVFHMNAAYGQLMWAEIVRAAGEVLAAAAPGQAQAAAV
ncbi:MAG TPA: hypothetical protein VF559_13135 [Caulobacteraceae bacterium]|jgi:hypothetical protein